MRCRVFSLCFCTLCDGEEWEVSCRLRWAMTSSLDTKGQGWRRAAMAFVDSGSDRQCVFCLRGLFSVYQQQEGLQTCRACPVGRAPWVWMVADGITFQALVS